MIGHITHQTEQWPLLSSGHPTPCTSAASRRTHGCRAARLRRLAWTAVKVIIKQAHMRTWTRTGLFRRDRAREMFCKAVRSVWDLGSARQDQGCPSLSMTSSRKRYRDFACKTLRSSRSCDSKPEVGGNAARVRDALRTQGRHGQSRIPHGWTNCR